MPGQRIRVEATAQYQGGAQSSDSDSSRVIAVFQVRISPSPVPISEGGTGTATILDLPGDPSSLTTWFSYSRDGEHLSEETIQNPEENNPYSSFFSCAPEGPIICPVDGALCFSGLVQYPNSPPLGAVSCAALDGWPPPTLSEITQEPLGQDATLSATAHFPNTDGHFFRMHYSWFSNIRGTLAENEVEYRDTSEATYTYDCNNQCVNREEITFRAYIDYYNGHISDRAESWTIIGERGGGIIIIEVGDLTSDPCFIPQTPTRIFTELITDEESPVNGAVKVQFFKEEIVDGEIQRSVHGANAVIFVYHNELNTRDGLDRNDLIWRFTTDDQGEAFLYMDEYMNFDPDKKNT